MNAASTRRPVSGRSIHTRWPASPALDRDRLDRAKALVPLSVAAAALGLALRPNGVQRSPLRPDRSPSFSVSQDRLWHDFADGSGGDVYDLVRAALLCSPGEAIKRVLAIAGLDHGAPLPPARHAPRPPAPTPAPKRDALRGLDLQRPTLREVSTVADLRSLPVWAGLEIAHERGMFFCADVRHRGETRRAWILTDDARKTAQARRLDGEQWPGPEGRTFKSLSLRSDDENPIGLADVVNADRPAVLVAEGEGDALAAFTVAWLVGAADRVGVLCLPGASRGLPDVVTEKLQGRRVRVIRQADKAGHKAAAAWLESLTAAGISADCIDFDGLTRADGTPAKDLADLIRRPAAIEQLEPLAAALLDGLLK